MALPATPRQSSHMKAHLRGECGRTAKYGIREILHDGTVCHHADRASTARVARSAHLLEQQATSGEPKATK